MISPHRAALDLGAIAAQLGKAFIACPESSADAAYRVALRGKGAEHTVMTSAIEITGQRVLISPPPFEMHLLGVTVRRLNASRRKRG